MTQSPAAADVEAYLDWAASTPMRASAVNAMVEATAHFGNPTGAHRHAREARRVVDDARELIGDALGAHPSEVIFTGGGTEADNLAIFGSCSSEQLPACSAVEHHAVLHPVEHLGGPIVGVDALGQLDLDHLGAALGDAHAKGRQVGVVSVMLANNETGVVQPLEPIAEVMHEHAPDALLHTDAIQAFPWIDVAAAASKADLISITGHKFGGPKGVGVLIVRKSAKISAHILGGGQEFELRSGTHNVAGIAGLGAAVAEMERERADTVARVGVLRDRLADGLIAAVPDTIETGVPTPGDRSAKVAGACHLCFGGIESETLLFLLERAGISASAASSCSAGAQDPSHVLAAMGYSRELAGGSLRLSLGYGSTDADVEHALAVIPPAVEQLRSRAA